MLTLRFKKVAACVALLAGLACVSTGAARAAASLVFVSVSVQPSVLSPGSHGTIAITMRITPGSHVNANKLQNHDFIPTSFQAGNVTGITFGTPRYPAGHDMTTAGMKQSVYEGTAVIKVPFTVAANAKRENVVLMGKLTYQACNTAVCFPPKTLNIITPVTVR